MGRTLIRLFLIVCCAVTAIAQEDTPSLGDLARQERERRAAARTTAEPELGSPPPAPLLGELIPAYFLRFEGEVADGEYSVFVNGKALLRNSRVRGLPMYVSPYLLEGGNQLEIGFASHAKDTLDVIIEERFAGDPQHREIMRFHADAGQFPQFSEHRFSFTAHPRLFPDVVLTETDRVAIHDVIRAFYVATAQKDTDGIMELFQAALEEAGQVYPEGAAFGKEEIARFAYLASMPECSMEHYSPAGLTFDVSGNIVTVKRVDGGPVFTSAEMLGDPEEAAASRVSADEIPVKKINNEWKLTLPFGF
jgi:hypothetical protein